MPIDMLFDSINNQDRSFCLFIYIYHESLYLQYLAKSHDVQDPVNQASSGNSKASLDHLSSLENDVRIYFAAKFHVSMYYVCQGYLATGIYVEVSWKHVGN